MGGPSFDEGGRCWFKDPAGHRIYLSRDTWQYKLLAHPERQLFAINFEKLAATVEDPDFIVESRSRPDTRLYHKAFETILTNAGQIQPFKAGYIAVVIRDDKQITTFFFLKTPKKGKVLWRKRPK